LNHTEVYHHYIDNGKIIPFKENRAARKRQKARKIIQAQFHKRMGIHDSIVSNLTLSGTIRGGV